MRCGRRIVKLTLRANVAMKDKTLGEALISWRKRAGEKRLMYSEENAKLMRG
jgi:hypothetical protein